jgi:hypothetical protein
MFGVKWTFLCCFAFLAMMIKCLCTIDKGWEVNFLISLRDFVVKFQFMGKNTGWTHTALRIAQNAWFSFIAESENVICCFYALLCSILLSSTFQYVAVCALNCNKCILFFRNNINSMLCSSSLSLVRSFVYNRNAFNEILHTNIGRDIFDQ